MVHTYIEIQIKIVLEALYFECRINKNALFQTVFLAIWPTGISQDNSSLTTLRSKDLYVNMHVKDHIFASTFMQKHV